MMREINVPRDLMQNEGKRRQFDAISLESSVTLSKEENKEEMLKSAYDDYSRRQSLRQKRLRNGRWLK